MKIKKRMDPGRAKRPNGHEPRTHNQVTIRRPPTTGPPSGPTGPIVPSSRYPQYQPQTGPDPGHAPGQGPGQGPFDRPHGPPGQHLYPPPVIFKPEEPSPDGASKPTAPPKPENGPKVVYRIRGLPAQLTRESTNDLLKRVLEVDEVVIESLAKDASDREESVATVRFPAAHPEALLTVGDDWSIEVEPSESPTSTHLFIDKHFDGFTPLCDPTTSEKDALDFVAIHGLGGHSLGSWRDKHSSHLWIRDSLPRDLKNARILAYGYRARVVNSESFETIDDIAALFCELFRDIRNSKDTRCRPVIFAAHSLGGLVLKAALGKMKYGSDDDRLCLSCTHGILCFGVPNQGMETSHMLAMIGGQHNVPLVLSLSKNPHALIPLNDRFNDAFPFRDSTVVSFYETETSSTMQQGPTGAPEMTGKRVVLVDWWSAQNGRTGMVEPRIPIKRDHSNMVKFSPRDEYYTVVKNRILSIASDALPVVSKRLENNHSNSQTAGAVSNGEGGPMEIKINGDSTLIEPLSKEQSKIRRQDPDILTKENGWKDAKEDDRENVRAHLKEIELLKRLSTAHVALSSKFERESALIWAVHEGELDMVDYILDRKTDPDSMAHIESMTVLSIAAKNGHEMLVDLLISRGADVNALDPLLRSALYIAAGHGRIAVMRRLIAAGALLQQKVMPGAKPTDIAISPLMNAARFGQEDAVAYLVDNGAKLNAQTHIHKWSALHAAICSGEYETVEMLLEQGADPNLASIHGPPLIHSVLHSKGDSKRLDIARLLLEYNADPDTKDPRGFAALHYATRRNDHPMCSLLLEYDADIDITGALGQTSLHLSIGLNHQRVTRLLERNHADTRRKDSSGRAPSPSRFDARTDAAYLPPRPHRYSSCLFLPLMLRPQHERPSPHPYAFIPDHYHLQHTQEYPQPGLPAYSKIQLEPSPQVYPDLQRHTAFRDRSEWETDPSSNLVPMNQPTHDIQYPHLRDDVTFSEAEDETISDTLSQYSSQMSSGKLSDEVEEDSDDRRDVRRAERRAERREDVRDDRRDDRLFGERRAAPVYRASYEKPAFHRASYAKPALHYQYVESDHSGSRDREEIRYRRGEGERRRYVGREREEIVIRRRSRSPSPKRRPPPRRARPPPMYSEVVMHAREDRPKRWSRDTESDSSEEERVIVIEERDVESTPPERPNISNKENKSTISPKAVQTAVNKTVESLKSENNDIWLGETSTNPENRTTTKIRDFGDPPFEPTDKAVKKKSSLASASNEAKPYEEWRSPVAPANGTTLLVGEEKDAGDDQKLVGWTKSKTKKNKKGTVAFFDFGIDEEKADGVIEDDIWGGWGTTSKKDKKKKKVQVTDEGEKVDDVADLDIWGWGATSKKDKKKKKVETTNGGVENGDNAEQQVHDVDDDEWSAFAGAKKKKKTKRWRSESETSAPDLGTQNGQNGVVEPQVEEPFKDIPKEAPVLDAKPLADLEPPTEAVKEVVEEVIEEVPGEVPEENAEVNDLYD